VGGQPPVSPRLLAATRVVAAQYASEAEGRTLEQMGDCEWHLLMQLCWYSGPCRS
jgi:hypothetical protein